MTVTETPPRRVSRSQGAVRWAPWVLLVAVATAFLVVGTHRTSHPSLDSQVIHIAGEVRCPVCNGETAAQSNATASIDIRNQIRADLVAGEKPDQILAGFVQAYGSWILEKPQANGVGLIVWVAPVVAFVLAAVALVAAFWRWRSRGGSGVEAAGEGEFAEFEEVGEAGELAGGASEASDASGTGGAIGAGEAGEPSIKTVETVEEVGPGAEAELSATSRWKRRVAIGAGVALIASGAGWAVAASSTTRLAGETASGQILPSDTVANDLQDAQSDAAKGDAVSALKLYQKVLASDPNQTEALSGEGWLLAETQQPTLLQQGITLLTSAEQTEPTYAPAHLYRGLAFLSEDDYSDAIPELQWYLAHNPDAALAPRVRTALKQAQTRTTTTTSTPAGR